MSSPRTASAAAKSVSASVSASGSASEPASFSGVSAGKLGMWTFLVTDAMGFGAIWIAYAVLRVRADVWPDPYERLDVRMAVALTVALLASSLTMSLAVVAARARRARARAGWLAATAVLGVAFLAGQLFEYRRLASGAGVEAMGLAHDTFASTFYALTGYHGLHVLAGVVYVTTLLGARVTEPRTLEVAALFWHFVDLAWIPIFSFVYLLPTV